MDTDTDTGQTNAGGSGVDTQVTGRVVTNSRMQRGNTTVENGAVQQVEHGQNADGSQTDTRGNGTITRGSTNVGPVKASVEIVDLDVESEQLDADGNVTESSQGSREEVKSEVTLGRGVGTRRGVNGELYGGANVIDQSEQTEFDRTNPEDGTSSQGTSEGSETQVNVLGGARASAGGRSVAVQAEAGVRISNTTERGVRDNGDGTYTEFEESEDSVGIGGAVRADIAGPTTDVPDPHSQGSARVEGDVEVTLSTDRTSRESTFDEDGTITERNTETSSENLFTSEREETNERFDDDGNPESSTVTRTRDTVFTSPTTETEVTTFDNLTSEDTDNDSQVDNSATASDSQEAENSDLSFTAPDPDYTDQELDEIGNGDYGGDQSSGWGRDDDTQRAGGSGGDDNGATGTGGGSAGGASGGGSSSDPTDRAEPAADPDDTDRSDTDRSDTDRSDTDRNDAGIEFETNWSVHDNDDDSDDDSDTPEPSRAAERDSAEAVDRADARSGDTHRPDCQRADSDPDGDGWGWENETTCVVVVATPAAEDDGDRGESMSEPSTPEPVAVWDEPFDRSTDAQGRPFCESDWSDSDGDGWGWENEATCVVRS